MTRRSRGRPRRRAVTSAFAAFLSVGSVAALRIPAHAGEVVAQKDGPQPQSPLAAVLAVRNAAAGRAAWALQRRGDQLLQAGDFRGAATAYQQAVRLSPADPVLRMASGVALAASGNAPAATQDFRAAWTLAPDDVVAAYLLQVALSEQGRTAEAQSLAQEMARRFAAPAAPLLAGSAAPLNASGSITRLRAATARFPASPVLWLLLGDACQIGEQWPAAETAYRRAGELAPRWAKPRVNQGIALLSQNRPDQAIRVFEDALALDPGNAQVLLSKGDAEVKGGRLSDAARTFARVKGSRQDQAEAKTRLGQVFVQTGDAARALDILRAAKRLAPNSFAPTAALAELHVRTGNYADGIAAYRSAIKLADAGGLISPRPVLLRGLAEAQLSLGRFDAARETLRRALEEEPAERPLWWRLIAETRFAERDTAGGENALRQALEADLDRYPLTILNAIAGRNLLARVTAFYNGQVNDPKRRGVALVALAHLAQYANDTSREISLRQQAVEAAPSGANWFLLADAYRQRGGPARFGEARSAYWQALRFADLPAGAQAEARDWLQKLAPSPGDPQQP